MKTLWLVLMISLLPLSGAAEEQEQRPKGEAEAEAQEEEDAAKIQARAPVKSKGEADDYEASEEISEDLSVSYPVDI